MRTTAIILATSVLFASSLDAQRKRRNRQSPQQAQPMRKTDRAAMREAREFRRIMVSGEQVKANVKRLTKELHWHKTLVSALNAGRRAGKPILWIHALGDLDGFL